MATFGRKLPLGRLQPPSVFRPDTGGHVLYPFRVESRRITIAGKQLAVVMRGWLRSTPDRLWGIDENYEALKQLKRQGEPPDPRREVADYIVSRLDEAGWDVSYPAPEQLSSPPPHDGSTTPRS